MKKKILSVVAAAALVASLTVPAWAAVGSPYGGAEAEGGDVTYTTQAQTGETSQATQVYETIQGAESTEQELGLLGDGLAETVQAELGETSVNEYRAREIGSVAVSSEGPATITLSNLAGVSAETEGFVMYLGTDGLWYYLPVTFGSRSATFTVPYSTTVILYVRTAAAV